MNVIHKRPVQPTWSDTKEVCCYTIVKVTDDPAKLGSYGPPMTYASYEEALKGIEENPQPGDWAVVEQVLTLLEPVVSVRLTVTRQG